MAKSKGAVFRHERLQGCESDNVVQMMLCKAKQVNGKSIILPNNGKMRLYGCATAQSMS